MKRAFGNWRPRHRTFPFAIILFLLLAGHAQALMTNNLVADWKADTGITSVGDRVALWTDAHQLLASNGVAPHQLSQTNTAAQPYEIVDAHGYHGVMFPWGFAANHPHTFLHISNSLGSFNSTNMTVYIVATGASSQENQSLIWLSGSLDGWIKLHQTAFNPSTLLVGTQASTIHPPINRAIFAGSSDPNATLIRWNNLTQTNSPQPAFITGNGGMLGANNGTEYYSGIIYRVLIYKAAHTAAEMDVQTAELARNYGVITNYTRQVVCRGASTIGGDGSTMLQNCTFQLWQRYPGILWRCQSSAFAGTTQTGTIGTNGISGSMYAVDDTFVDSLYDGKMRENWLFVLAGLNDLHTDGVTGFAAFGRLTNYVAARKAVVPWKVVVATLQASVLSPPHTEFNLCLRTNAGNWDRLVDAGLDSPVESRLSVPGNSLYFVADGIHLNNAGYTVLVEHFSQIINTPNRSTGFFGP